MWGIPSILDAPELRGLSRRTLRDLKARFIHHPELRYWVSLARAAQLAVTLLALGVGLLAALTQVWPNGVIVASLVAVVWFLFTTHIARLTAAYLKPEFVRYVIASADNGRPVPCAACGYDLRASPLTSNAACPECGALRFPEKVAPPPEPLSRPRQRARAWLEAKHASVDSRR